MANKKHVYLVAPMNINNGNHSEISLAKEKLQALGFTVVTAHDLLEGVDTSDFKNKDFMRVRISGLALCHQVVNMPQWDADTDATDEIKVARIIGLDVTNIINFLQKHGNN